MLVHPGGSVERLEATSTVLGLFRDLECATAETRLEPGDSLVLYTDGVPEALSDRAEEFGELRLMGVLVRSAAMGRPAAVPSAIKKGACIDVLPEGMTVLEKFEVAKRAGFDGIEPNTLNSTNEVNQYRGAAKKTGVRITSIMNSDHWKYPLSDSDPEVVRKSVEGLKTSMHNAHDPGAGAVLLVPGVVTADVPYAEVYRRSQHQIRKLLPLARELKVIIAIETWATDFC